MTTEFDLESFPGSTNEAAALWCVRLAEGGFSKAEEAEFDLWHADAQNAAALARAVLVWQATGDIRNWPEVITMRVRAQAEVAAEQRTIEATSQRRYWHYAAAMLVLIFAVSTTAFYFWPAKPNHEIATDAGERQITMLADGSRISMDASSKVSVDMDENRRQIELEQGRAKFDVKKDSLRPFVVVAGDKLIAATGTSFSVEVVGNKVRVILYEGQVEVRDRDDVSGAASTPGQRQVMAPGQELVSAIGARKPATLVEPDLSQSLEWEQGMLVFDDVPLAEAVARMNRYGSVQITISSPELNEIKVNGVFNGGDPDAFVEGVSTLHGVRAEKASGEITLSLK